MGRNTITIRVDPALKKLLDDIKLEKIKNGSVDTLLSDARLTKAITRIPNIKQFMVSSNIKNDKK